MSITADRLQTINFSDPYYNTPTVIVGQRSMAFDATPEGLAGKVLGVQVSTIHQTYAQAYFEAATELRTYQTQDEANQDLAAGRIDATQADSLAMDDFLLTDAGACCEVKGAVAHDEGILGSGVGARAMTRCARRSIAGLPRSLPTAPMTRSRRAISPPRSMATEPGPRG
jgi:polar amino acid transport system substrate-binding protein